MVENGQSSILGASVTSPGTSPEKTLHPKVAILEQFEGDVSVFVRKMVL